MSKVLDKVWVVVLPNDAGVIYAVSGSLAELWADIEERELMGTGITAEALRRNGYRAKRVEIVLP